MNFYCMLVIALCFMGFCKRLRLPSWWYCFMVLVLISCLVNEPDLEQSISSGSKVLNTKKQTELSRMIHGFINSTVAMQNITRNRRCVLDHYNCTPLHDMTSFFNKEKISPDWLHELGRTWEWVITSVIFL